MQNWPNQRISSLPHQKEAKAETKAAKKELVRLDRNTSKQMTMLKASSILFIRCEAARNELILIVQIKIKGSSPVRYAQNAKSVMQKNKKNK